MKTIGRMTAMEQLHQREQAMRFNLLYEYSKQLEGSNPRQARRVLRKAQRNYSYVETHGGNGGRPVDEPDPWIEARYHNS